MSNRNRFEELPNVCGPRFGVEAAENGTYRAAIYERDGKVKLSDKRQEFGGAWAHAFEWSQTLGVKRP